MLAKTLTAQSLQGKFVAEFKLGYLVHLPAAYGQSEETRWPLILFLHGAGERGTNLAKVTVHGPPKIVRDQPDFPFIVVAPQCPAGETWSNEALLALLDKVSADYRVDPGRVYLTGLSMGGFGTWNLAVAQPTRFAAIAPICGGGDILSILLAAPGRQAALKALPIWAFHGAKDDIVPLGESERMIGAFRRLGNNSAQFTVYPEAGHDSWSETYQNKALYDWFLQQRRNKKSAPRKASRAARSAAAGRSSRSPRSARSLRAPGSSQSPPTQGSLEPGAEIG